jgi:hypothetical protein
MKIRPPAAQREKTSAADCIGGPLLKKLEKWRTPGYYESRIGEVAHPPDCLCILLSNKYFTTITSAFSPAKPLGERRARKSIFPAAFRGWRWMRSHG